MPLKIYLLISCFAIPYLLLFKKLSDIIKNFLKQNFLLTITGLIFFSFYPLFFDIIKFNLNSSDIFYRIIYILIPFLALSYKDQKVKQIKYKRIMDLIVFVILWLPVELDILPGGKLKYTDTIIIQTTLLGMIPVGLYFYLVVSPIPEKYYNFSFNLSIKDLINIIIPYILIVIIILPIGLFIKFLVIKTDLDFFLIFFLEIIAFFILITIPEEFFFRIIFINAIKMTISRTNINILTRNRR